MIIEVTMQMRVSDFQQGLRWYTTLLQRDPGYTPHAGFAEWELVPGMWLQVAEGAPTPGSGPLRLGVTNLAAERDRVVAGLGVQPFDIFSRNEVNAKWATFTDPWGNRLGFFEYLDKEDEAETIAKVLGRPSLP